MAGKVGDRDRRTVALDILVAGVDRPERIRDLTAHQYVVVGIARPQRHIRLALGQVDILVAEHELDLEAGIPGLEPVQNSGLCQAEGDRFGTCQTDDADKGTAQISQRQFEVLRRGRHAFGMRQDGNAQFGQPVA